MLEGLVCFQGRNGGEEIIKKSCTAKAKKKFHTKLDNKNYWTIGRNQKSSGRRTTWTWSWKIIVQESWPPPPPPLPQSRTSKILCSIPWKMKISRYVISGNVLVTCHFRFFIFQKGLKFWESFLDSRIAKTRTSFSAQNVLTTEMFISQSF